MSKRKRESDDSPKEPNKKLKLEKKMKNETSNVPISSNWKALKQTLPQSQQTNKKFYSKKEKSSNNEKDEKDHEKNKIIDLKTTTLSPNKLILQANSNLSQYIGLDCEMVGIGVGGVRSVLARVTIINFDGNPVYDTFVRPEEQITNFRTKISGVTPQDLKDAPLFSYVQKDVAALIKNRIVIGHGLNNDFKALLLSHPFYLIRDTARYGPLQKSKGRPHSLKYLAKKLLDIEIQTGDSHDPLEDARTAVLVYKSVSIEWEASIMKGKKKKQKKN